MGAPPSSLQGTPQTILGTIRGVLGCFFALRFRRLLQAPVCSSVGGFLLGADWSTHEAAAWWTHNAARVKEWCLGVPPGHGTCIPRPQGSCWSGTDL